MSDTNRIQITAAIGLVGLITAVTLILTDAMRDVSHAWTGAAGFICLAAIGAAAAGYICAGLFGRNGVWGWWCAGCGAVSSMALGAVGGHDLCAGLWYGLCTRHHSGLSGFLSDCRCSLVAGHVGPSPLCLEHKGLRFK